MNQISEIVQNFFNEYEGANNALDLELLGSQYADSFLFAGPAGALPIKRDDFIKILPKRSGFFKSIGLLSSKIIALEETRLDKSHFLVRVDFEMRFQKAESQVINEKISATYILFQQDNKLQIVFQLDHQDLTQRIKELGLYPAEANE